MKVQSVATRLLPSFLHCINALRTGEAEPRHNRENVGIVRRQKWLQALRRKKPLRRLLKAEKVSLARDVMLAVIPNYMVQNDGKACNILALLKFPRLVMKSTSLRRR